MAADGNYFVYETIPYTYSPLSLASSSPLDNYHSLTRSMRDMTAYADLIASPLRLCLRPSIDWRQSADGFVLSAATPGLRKDELKVELLDDRGESYLEVSGQTLDKHDHIDQQSSNDGAEPQAEAAQSKETTLELRATYGGFRKRVRLPRGVDREAMRATYEDGLLLVTIPMKKADAAKRQKIAIA